MPRFIVPPKYIYSQESGELRLPIHPENSPAGNVYTATYSNGMFPWQTVVNEVNKKIIAPTPELPVIGNGHDKRTHSRITVQSIRWKLTMELDMTFLTKGSINIPYDNPQNPFPITTAQWPINPGQFYKFRYFMVEFDEDLAVNPDVIYNWFFATYCYYRQPVADPILELPSTTETSSLRQIVPGPISVHSNIMRITTPWVGKFKILADKCFEVTANRPRVSIDLTIPINRVYLWDDENPDPFTESSALIRPHIYCFVLPPLSYEQDIGVYDTYFYESNASDSTLSTQMVPFIKWDSWMKLNFVDI